MIPAEWEARRLTEIATYKAGRTPARANAAYWNTDGEGVPWVTISDMADFGTITETKEAVSKAAFADVFRRQSAPAGTLLMSFKLTIGRIATLGIDACHNEAIISIFPQRGIDQRYLGYFLAQVDYADLQDRQIMGNTLNQEKIDRIEVLVPPLKEQSSIADVLDLVRRAVSGQERALSVAQALKRSAMRELFSRGLRSEAQCETEIGSMPQGWKVTSCEDLAEVITVGVVVRPASYYVATGVPAFRSLNVKEDRLDPSQLVYFSEKDNEGALSKSRLRVGDILVVRTGYPGTSCVVPKEFDGANCIDLVVVRPKHNEVLSGFLSRFFNSDFGKSQVLANSYGLAQQHLNVGAVRRMRVPLPQTLDEQREIVAVLEAIDRKIALHRHKRSLLDALFKALLQKLMTGEIRVGDPELLALASEQSAGVAA